MHTQLSNGLKYNRIQIPSTWSMNLIHCFGNGLDALLYSCSAFDLNGVNNSMISQREIFFFFQIRLVSKSKRYKYTEFVTSDHLLSSYHALPSGWSNSWVCSEMATIHCLKLHWKFNFQKLKAFWDQTALIASSAEKAVVFFFLLIKLLSTNKNK